MKSKRGMETEELIKYIAWIAFFVVISLALYFLLKKAGVTR